MLGSGFGTYAMIVELTHKGINLKYGGFQTKEIFNLYNTKAINGKNIVYNLGIDDGAVDNFNNYKFNKEKQTISFRKTSEYWRDDKKDTLTIGTLTFNGKYFTEKLKKQKYDINE